MNMCKYDKFDAFMWSNKIKQTHGISSYNRKSEVDGNVRENK